MSQKRKRPADSDAEGSSSDDIYRSEAIEDRTSRFIGYFSPTLKPEALQNHAEFASASHKILAWRRESNQQAITGRTNYVVGHDDDGEKYGGKKVEKVLESMQVVGACVVARWYGGVMLGPVRFTHMEECAKGAVQKWKDSLVEERAKKRKAEEDAGEKARLEVLLPQRDESIVVLRKLAAQRESEVKTAEAGGGGGGEAVEDQAASAQSVASPAKPTMNYTSLPVEKLRTLDKARDATLAFLLKRIDGAEAALVRLRKKDEKAGDGSG
ncbi:ribosomal protein S5 domain 2-type protein [Neohortaea acidophila]|uniref:Ribosomal protein S5 domain 2-type protein n=1 Tax=Neohortaea acidophila TaxID=245834 RepID=A0A6A6PKB7_9PEZI|nr:ribosomal protein S5 domain 2-type protein [Neohortaea acidophila]KAF2480500.1 ribosomal protein S5 domain 2-type protein [Neohortaea acidophila]